MQYLIVIPARGGSKGIPEKNIAPLNGKPLLTYTLDLLRSAKLENADVVVSTDSERIKTVANNYDFVNVLDRPSEISGDTASTEDALLHALKAMEDITGKRYDAVITLQATSPLRKEETLKGVIYEYERTYPEYNAILSVNENRSDFWRKKDNGEIERLNKNAPRRRQEREPLYVENSAYYITESESLRMTHSVLGSKVRGVVISDQESIDINEPIDLVYAEVLLSKEF